jgi:hypothetical protein
MRVTLSHVLRHRRHVALKKTPPEKFPAIDAGADSTNQVNWAGSDHRHRNNNPSKRRARP